MPVPTFPCSIAISVARVIPAFSAKSFCRQRRRMRAVAMFAPSRATACSTAAAGAWAYVIRRLGRGNSSPVL
jgi:hypothetical protein